MAVTYASRKEVPEEFTWDLGDIFPTTDAWLAEYESLKVLSAGLGSYQGTLGASAQGLLGWLEAQDEISVRLGKLYGYAACLADEDLGDALGQDLRGKALGVLVAIQSACAFAAPEIMAIPD